eukprot:c11174_g1_i2.p1 GENE.c11174_g1_i2~~c11174_g1_i2.p1  ORF type:complete len:305 (+),score=58.57 c11174_g1_i2:50-916(+)
MTEQESVVHTPPQLNWISALDFSDQLPELAALLTRPSVQASETFSFLRSPTRATILSGGLTNRLYCVEVGKDGAERWVVRVSGENTDVHFIDRTNEFKCLVCAHAAGLSPETIYLPEDSLLCSKFIENGHTWNNPVIQKNVPRCAEMIRRLHSIPTSEYTDHIFDVFQVIEHYNTFASQHNSPVPQDLPTLAATANRIRDSFARGRYSELPLVCCHNDLLAANWIDQAGKLWLIDFEYAGLGDRFFDLANVSANCGFSEEMDRVLVTEYFGSFDSAAFARFKLMKVYS